MNFKTATPACAASIFLELHTYKFEKAPQLHNIQRLIVPAICFFQRKFLTKQKLGKTNKGTWAGQSLPEWLDFVNLNKIISFDEELVEKLSKTALSMSVWYCFKKRSFPLHRQHWYIAGN